MSKEQGALLDCSLQWLLWHLLARGYPLSLSHPLPMSWLFSLLPCCPSAAQDLLFGKGLYACDEAELGHVQRIQSIVSRMPLLAMLNEIASSGNAKNSAEIQ